MSIYPLEKRRLALSLDHASAVAGMSHQVHDIGQFALYTCRSRVVSSLGWAPVKIYAGHHARPTTPKLFIAQDTTITAFSRSYAMRLINPSTLQLEEFFDQIPE